MNATTTDLISALRRPEAYPHPVGRIELHETHISWVILTGVYAYKIKKPVNFGFLDFSTLEKRRHFCEEEVRINRRLSPRLYLAVAPIAGDPAHPQVDGEGPVIDYAVRMRQFDSDLLWDRMADRNELSDDLIDRLAGQIAAFHEETFPPPADALCGFPSVFWTNLESIVADVRRAVAPGTDMARLDRVVSWMRAVRPGVDLRMIHRRDAGRVREGHGDLHLGNIALFSREDPQIVVFDAIEFDDNLRWIDVMNDVSFLTMDLDHRGCPALGWRFLNTYLEITGDYGGMDLLRFYSAYRALVRARVIVLRRAQTGYPAEAAELSSYLDLASSYTREGTRRLFITHGFSGSGKTTAARHLMERLGAVRLRSDVERRRLFGLPPTAPTPPAARDGIYNADASRRTYARLARLARDLLASGHSVIADATFLRREDRDAFRTIAEQTGADFRILDFRVAPDILRRRIADRLSSQADASEADLAVLAAQERSHEELGAEEWPLVIRPDEVGAVS